MFHISWWYLLLVLVFPVIILVLSIILQLFDYLVDIIFIMIYNFSHNEKYLNIMEKDIGHYLSNKLLNILNSNSIFSTIIIILFLIIPINNFINWIRLNIKNDNIRIEQNTNYLKDKDYNYYRISSNNPKYNSDSSYIYLIYTKKSIEELLKEKYIKIDDNTYIKPYTITKITLQEFVNRYPNLINSK